MGTQKNKLNLHVDWSYFMQELLLPVCQQVHPNKLQRRQMLVILVIWKNKE